MSYETIQFEPGAIARITLNRPNRLNSFTAQMHEELRDALAKLDAGNLEDVAKLADLHARVRGYGHVKARHLADAKKREAELLARFRETPAAAAAVTLVAAAD